MKKRSVLTVHVGHLCRHLQNGLFLSGSYIISAKQDRYFKLCTPFLFDLDTFYENIEAENLQNFKTILRIRPGG